MADNPRGGQDNWFRITNKSAGSAEVYIYDVIGEWGQPASEFVNQLREVDAEEIQLHVNSPGGNVYDAVAILNSLRSHPARVVATVDGLAASAASFIVQAGDEIVMSRNSEMMIHDARGIAVGDTKVMADLAERLDQISNNIASIYADRAGGTADEWREVMKAETWFSAQEAVDAGLADRVDEGKGADESVTARFDMSVFNHAGRRDAPAPVVPTLAPTPKRKTENVSAAEAAAKIHNAPVRGTERRDSTVPQYEITDELAANVRQRLGLADDAEVGPEQVAAALTAPQPGAEVEPSGQQEIEAETEKAPVKRTTPGTMTIDASAWEEREARIKRLEAAAAKRAREERDEVIASAVRDGKFPPARKGHWARLWDADPEGTREVINGLTKNVIPVDALGIADDGDSSLDDEFASLFPPAQKGA
jgi:ATP-dependent protease ClpP protease subunit